MSSKLFKNPLYCVWCGMKQRCRGTTSSVQCNNNYKGRGISICEEWLNNFKPFEDWAIRHGYKKGLSVDRIDNNGNYCPENCRFSTASEQSDNRRITVKVILNGKLIPASYLWRTYGMSASSVLHKIKRYGLSGDEILREFTNGNKRNHRK